MRKEEIKDILMEYKNFSLTDKIIESITDKIFDLIIDDITQSVFVKEWEE